MFLWYEEQASGECQADCILPPQVYQNATTARYSHNCIRNFFDLNHPNNAILTRMDLYGDNDGCQNKSRIMVRLQARQNRCTEPNGE